MIKIFFILFILFGDVSKPENVYKLDNQYTYLGSPNASTRMVINLTSESNKDIYIDCNSKFDDLFIRYTLSNNNQVLSTYEIDIPEGISQVVIETGGVQYDEVLIEIPPPAYYLAIDRIQFGETENYYTALPRIEK